MRPAKKPVLRSDLIKKSRPTRGALRLIFSPKTGTRGEARPASLEQIKAKPAGQTNGRLRMPGATE
jgi:hypothetical protein